MAETTSFPSAPGGRPAEGAQVPSASSLPYDPSAEENEVSLAQPQLIAAVPQTHYDLPAYQAPRRPDKIVRGRRRGRMGKRKKLLLRMTALSGALVFTLGGLLAWNGYVKMHRVFHGTATVAALAAKPAPPQLLKGEGDGRVNILLLGIGGPGHDGPDLTDTIMLLSVDPVNNTASLLSIPRDLWVKQPVNYFGAEQKINAVYESGKYHYLGGKKDSSNDNAAAVEAGFSTLDQVVSTVTGLHVNYHVLVNFTAFQQAIDTVGGVTVNVPTQLYDPTFSWMNNGNPVIAEAGVQTMDGYKALEYARSRETSSDFARGQRQRQILVALKDKVLTAGTLSNPAKIESLMNAFGDNVFSDLSTQGAERLYTIMKKVGDNSITSLGLTDPPHQLITTDHVGNQSVDRPVAGFDNYGDIQAFLRTALPDGYIVKEHAAIMVVSQTQAAADATATLLKSYGYNVTTTTTTDQTVSAAAIVDLSGGNDPYTLHYLQGRIGAKPVSELPPGITVDQGSAKFVIIEP